MACLAARSPTTSHQVNRIRCSAGAGEAGSASAIATPYQAGLIPAFNFYANLFVAQNPKTSSNMSTAPKCILLQEVPLEIRLRIYEFVLAQDEEIQLTYSEASRRLVRTRPLPLGPLTCLNLLLVCRQIRNEAAQVFTSINNLKLIVPVLGQYLKLVQGQGVCDESLVPALDVLTTWLRWSADRSTRVDIQLGCWFTWWERSTADVVASAMKRLLAALESGNAKVTVAMSVNWTATPGVHGGFDVELPLWDLAEGRRRIDERIERQREQINTLVHQFCLWENIRTCQEKFDHLFQCLDEFQTREELLGVN